MITFLVYLHALEEAWRPLPTNVRSVTMYMSTCTIMQYALCIMGMVDGCGYHGQHKCTICEACRPCHSILSILKPVFCPIRLFCCSYKLLRCLDLQIGRFLCPQKQRWQQHNQLYFIPCTCTQGKNTGRRVYNMLQQDRWTACYILIPL